MTRNKQYNEDQQADIGNGAQDTALLEAGCEARLRPYLRGAAEPHVSGLRRVHSSLYTLQAYKRWMHQIRENWKSDKR